jgi:xylan 1,4-beta-xylosidase
VFQNDIPVARDRMVCRSVRKVSDEIKASAMPSLPLIFSEYNASFANEPNVTDSIYMGPWLASTISQCDGLTEAMAYWTFSDVFEEGGVVKTPFYGGFGLLAEDNIPKPAYNAFALLHRLGSTRLKSDSDSALITRRSNGALAIALWNYAPPDGTGEHYTPEHPPGPPQHFVLELRGVSGKAQVSISRVDADHGNVIKAFDAMGRPPTPSREQLDALRAAARLPPPQRVVLNGGKLEVDVPTQGLVLVELH